MSRLVGRELEGREEIISAARGVHEQGTGIVLVSIGAKGIIMVGDREQCWAYPPEVEDFRDNSGLNIRALGYTVYPGSEYEAEMLRHAAQIVYNAHQYGLITVLWMYPRGKAVADEKDPHLIAGATGVAACLGRDFVKVNYPKKEGYESGEIFKEAILAAGRTNVICAGGSSVDVESFLKRLHNQIHISGAAGNATGRNIHQKSLEDAIRMCNAIYAITVEEASVAEALKTYKLEVQNTL